MTEQLATIHIYICFDSSVKYINYQLNVIAGTVIITVCLVAYDRYLVFFCK